MPAKPRLDAGTASQLIPGVRRISFSYVNMDSKEHCCAEMEEKLKFKCSQHADAFECPAAWPITNFDNLLSLCSCSF